MAGFLRDNRLISNEFSIAFCLARERADGGRVAVGDIDGIGLSAAKRVPSPLPVLCDSRVDGTLRNCYDSGMLSISTTAAPANPVQ